MSSETQGTDFEDISQFSQDLSQSRKRLRDSYGELNIPKLARQMAMTYKKTGRKFVKRYSIAKRSNRPQAGRPELKFRDITVAPAVVSDAGVVATAAMNQMGLGTTHSNRIGSKVRTEYVQIKGCFAVGSAAEASCHLMVVLDRQPNGALPTFNQVFNSYASGQYMRNIGDTPERFKVLATRSYNLGLGGTDEANINIYIPGSAFKGKDRYTYFNSGNANDITDISSNSILILALSNKAGATGPTLNVIGRYRFKDE